MHPKEFFQVVNLYDPKYIENKNLKIKTISEKFIIHTFAVVSIHVSNVSQATLKSDSLNS